MCYRGARVITGRGRLGTKKCYLCAITAIAHGQARAARKGQTRVQKNTINPKNQNQNRTNDPERLLCRIGPLTSAKSCGSAGMLVTCFQ